MSEIKVNKISPRTNCGTVTVGDSGDSVSVAPGVAVTVNDNLTVSGDLKSAALKAADGGSIISQSGTTITLGASGDTVELASGASQTGFGRTGTVDWQTTPKTSNFTAANGEGYFVNTTSGAITMTMPSGSAGAIVSIQDYNKTFDSNNFTINPASGEKINGGAADGPLIIATEGQGITFVYVDSTVGWKSVHENEFTAGGALNIVATGGTITECGNFKIHTFTGPGTFTVCQVSNTAAENTVGYLVIAGGGGGGGGSAPDGSSGGGAGGFREGRNVPIDNFCASPLVANAPTNAVTVTATSYPITVGGGGAGGTPGSASPGSNGAQGAASIFSTITSAGGGGGSGHNNANRPAGNGGSGAGAGGGSCRSGQTGNSPPTTPAQGNNGGGSGPGSGGSSGGGGGAGGTGVTGTPGGSGNGGNGIITHITGSPVIRAGGGGGGGAPPRGTPAGGAGPGGGGAGATGTNPGTCNTGGGGGGADSNPGGNGGSGLVVIRYKFQ